MSREEQLTAMVSRIERIEVAHAQQRRSDLLRLSRDTQVPGSWLPVSKVFLLFVMVLALKAVAISSLGQAAYMAHVQALSTGTTLERMVGILLTPDRISVGISQYLSF